jgi:hypothetical protein
MTCCIILTLVTFALCLFSPNRDVYVAAFLVMAYITNYRRDK